MARDSALAAGQQAHNQWLSPLRSRLLEDSRQLEVPAQRDMQHLHPSCRSPTPADSCKLLHGHILPASVLWRTGDGLRDVWYFLLECGVLLDLEHYLPPDRIVLP
jgi:hypothetical protein